MLYFSVFGNLPFSQITFFTLQEMNIFAKTACITDLVLFKMLVSNGEKYYDFRPDAKVSYNFENILQ